jgi:S1-C subfamily serine protease
LHEIDDLQDALQGRQAGETVPVRLSRGGVTQSLDVLLGERARKSE